MKLNSYKDTHEEGFTLIELSVVILIIAILVLPLIQMYNANQITKKVTASKDSVTAAVSSISALPIRYPCPSDRSLPTTDPNYGVENCVLASIPTCTAALQGICKVQSLRDANGDGTNDLVVIGGVPQKYYENYFVSGLPDTSKLSDMPGLNSENILDGWGNQLTYAVSAVLMNPLKTNSFDDFKNGVITAVDENGNPTAGIEDNGQFVVVSHGRNQSGSFSKEGFPTACPAGSTETENCDQDSTFTSAIGYYEGAAGTYFDDYTRFYMRSAGDLWFNIVNSGVTSKHITHRNSQNVGVNMTTNPAYKLEVGGTIRASSVRTDEICGPVPAVGSPVCMPANLLSSLPSSYGVTNSTNVNYCNDGQIAIEITGGKLKCGYPAFRGPANEERRCAAGAYVREIKTNGCIVCNDGSQICTP